MSVIIGADIVPTSSNRELFSNGCSEELFGTKIVDLIKKSDFSIFNLEAPLTDITDGKIKKNGPSICSSEESILAMKQLNISLFTLANNHIMDFGEKGLLSTMNVLKRYGVEYTGVGLNVYEARKPFFFTTDSVKFGVYSCVEHEFSVASEKLSGANPYDPLVTFDDISDAKKECDFLIVLYHGGKEFYQYPSPMLQKRCRKMIEKGADLVVCQHSHCIGAYEQYDTGTIVYGQGNFLFDDGTDSPLWDEGLLLRITNDLRVEFIPIVRCDNKVRLAESKEKEKILDSFFKRSSQIQNMVFLKEQYETYAKNNIEDYLMHLKGTDCILIRCIYKLFKSYSRKNIFKRYRTDNRLFVKNVIECEAHRELLIEGLNGIINE